MMNTTEHLLVCLAEECGEVAKECSKALRFGLDDQLTLNPDGPRGTEGPTNREKIIAELNDLCGVVRMLEQHGVLPRNCLTDTTAQENKAIKVTRYMRYAVRVGTLEVEV